jgi:DNA polymerase-1
MGNAVDVLGVKEVCEKWDIENVSQVIDMLGLQGDSSDNIPGIPGFGPKTAATLLKQYGTVENIVAHASDLKGKQKELVTQFGEQAILSKKLATIITDVPVAFDEEGLKYKGPNADKLKPIFNDLEFKSILARAFGEPNTEVPRPVPHGGQLSMFASDISTNIPGVEEKKNLSAANVQYQTIENANQLKELVVRLRDQKIIAIDSFTDDAANFDFQLKGIALSYRPTEAYFVPTESQEKAGTFIQELMPVFADTKITKVGHNLKATLLNLKKHNADVAGPLFDVMLAHYLIEPEASHDLAILCSQYLNYELLSDKETNVKDRLCERAELLVQLRSKLYQELEQRRHVKLMMDTEMPLSRVLATMEFEGVKIDTTALSKMSEELKLESERVQREIFQMAGVEFNIGSPKQLGDVIFDKMKLMEKPKKTKSGQYATGEDVLITLASKHEIARKILDYREYEKLRSTYVDALPRMISKTDGRVHTDYRQAWAVTGRLSSNNPNLQNIPIRTEKGRSIRKAFIARNDDYFFMSADYSQIELRIAASFARDATMIEAFRNKRDIHTTTAAKVFKVDLASVTPDMRRKAKEVNFGILYGSTAFGLSQNLGISRTEAQEIIQSYFTEFAAIKRYMDDSINNAREKEYVETLLGRRRYLRDINSRNVTTRGFAERNAINAPIQGSAADIIKIAMVNINRWLEKEKLRSKMTMQVHDELVFDVHKEEVDVVKENVVNLMKYAVHLEVPMEVEVGVGLNWLEAH